MLLKEIYENSSYVTDEDMSSSQIVALANSAIAEINTKIGTKLPFYTNENYQTITYDKFDNSWQLRLIEPYLSYSIAANDSDVNARDFHYERFKMALREFQISGISSIKTDDVDSEGNIIDYVGTSKRVVKLDGRDRANPFRGWWI